MHALAFNHTQPELHNLFATVGKDQATVYDDEHMADYLGIVVHFANGQTEHTAGGVRGARGCWAREASSLRRSRPREESTPVTLPALLASAPLLLQELQACCWLNTSGWTEHPHGDACLAVAGADPNISVISTVEAAVTKLLKGESCALCALSTAEVLA